MFEVALALQKLKLQTNLRRHFIKNDCVGKIFKEDYKEMKRLLFLLVAVLLSVSMLSVFVFTGCKEATAEETAQEGTGEETAVNEGPINVAVIVKATDSEFWQYVIIGAENAAKENPDKVKVTIFGPASEADIDEQVDILENVISNKPDAIVIASSSSEATVPALERAYEQGITVITIDNAVMTDKVHSFLATDNIKGGELAAENLVKAIEDNNMELSGKIGLISAMAGVQVLIDRDGGFEDKLAELAPELELLEVRYTDNDMVKSLGATEDIITANEDLIGIFADNNMTGNGVAKAIEERGLEDEIAVVAFDSDPQEVESLRIGAIDALIVQDPYGMGYKGVMYAYDVAVGETIPEYIDTGVVVVTRDNVDDEDMQGLIDPTLKKK